MALGEESRFYATALAAALLPVVFAEAPVAAAEIQLRRQCRCDGGVVTLGDVAQIAAASPQEACLLASVELLPAPPTGQLRVLRAREIQDSLLLCGIKLADHRFSGFSDVTVYGAAPPKAAEQESPSAAATREAERLVRNAVQQHLRQLTGTNEVGDIEFTMDDEQAKRVHGAGGLISVRGGTAPWTGKQQLEIVLGGPGSPDSIPLAIQVRTFPAVVVAVRPIPCGAVVTAADVELRSGTAGQTQQACFHSIDDVVGCEAAQAISEGIILQNKMVRSPLLVRKGEIVTVYARARGIRVHTTARARDAGSMGEMVAVETLAGRKVLTARVSGTRELEVDMAKPRQRDPMSNLNQR